MHHEVLLPILDMRGSAGYNSRRIAHAVLKTEPANSPEEGDMTMIPTHGPIADLAPAESAPATSVPTVAPNTAQVPKARPSRYEYEQLIACGRGELEGLPQLPAPPMLMFDRIVDITIDGGKYGKGQVQAVLQIKRNLFFWFCHFIGRPVMPGCLQLDALWQMLGFFLGWSGIPGEGYALGLGNLRFSGKILPTAWKVEYGVDVKKIIRTKGSVIIIGDGWVKRDGEVVCVADGLMVIIATETAQA